MTNPYTHFYSDPHYGHANIIGFANRPFRDVEEMNRELERRYVDAINAYYATTAHEDPDAHVLWCGDCAWSGYDLGALLKRLPGCKTLVRGNHDKGYAKMLALGFDAVVDEVHLRMKGLHVEVRHYPPRHAGPPEDPSNGHRYHRDNAADRFIHGHTHEPGQVYGRRIHVGVDAWDYRPATWAGVEELI